MEGLSPPNGNAIRRQVDGWNAALWRNREKRAKIEEYANGGPPPLKDPKKDPKVIPLGLARTFMTKARDALTDMFDQKPGPVYLKLVNPVDPATKDYVENAVNEEFNALILKNKTDFTYAAGNATCSGTCSWYRTSPNNIRWNSGDVLFPPDAPINPEDSQWREWAYVSQLTIEEVDELIGLPEKKAGDGWAKSALEQLKLYIMASQYQKRPDEWRKTWGEYDRQKWLKVALSPYVDCGPISVAWYFRKNGEHTEDKNDYKYYGHEKIDMMCISRYGALQSVQTSNEMRGGKIQRWSETTYPNIVTEKNGFAKLLGETIMNPDYPEWPMNVVLYRKDNAFRSVDECLRVHTDDVRVAGSATLSEVRGPGTATMGRLALEEGLSTAVLEGLTMGARFHWQEEQNGVAIDKIRGIQAGGGLPSFSVIPNGIIPAQKNNSFAGFAPAMEFIRMIDGTISSDGAAASPMFGSKQAEFQIQAQAEQSDKMKTALKRFRKWADSCQALFEVQACAVLRKKEWTKKQASYWDVMRFFYCLQQKYGIMAEDIGYERWEVQTRLLSGELQGQQAVTQAAQAIQLFAPIFPQIAQPLAREALTAIYGSSWANANLGPGKRDIAPAQTAIASALSTGVVPEFDPSVQALDYVQEGLRIGAPRLQMFAQAGQINPADYWGMVALFQFTQQQAQRLPLNVAEEIIPQIQELAKGLATIPQMEAPPDKELELKERTVKVQETQQERLAADGEFKKQNQQVTNLIKSRTMLTQEQEAQKRMQAMDMSNAEKAQKMVMNEIEAQTPEIEDEE